MYRPQFPYPPAPPNCEDQRCIYSFDGTNTPLLNGTVAVNMTYNPVPLQLDQDADFFLRGIQVSINTLLVGLADPGGHPLLYPTSYGLPPVLLPALWAQCDGGPIVALDSDDWGVFCRAGSVLRAFIKNSGATAAPVTAPVITLHGIKRFKGTRCA